MPSMKLTSDKMSDINWIKIQKAEKLFGERIYDRMINSLLDMNILTFTPEWNWYISSNNVQLNLSTSFGDELYFTKRKYAEEFVNQIYGNISHKIEIKRS